MSKVCYAVALGSNRSHYLHGPPRRVLEAAFAELNKGGLHLCARSKIIASPPLGPSRRTFANAAALVETGLPPPALLKRLKEIEADFGKRAGQRWGARTLDLDIVLWSGGLWSDRSLTIPHPSFRERNFVLAPLTQIAPRWHDPVTSLTIWQLHMRLKKPKPVDRRPKPD